MRRFGWRWVGMCVLAVPALGAGNCGENGVNDDVAEVLKTFRASVSSKGVQADGPSFSPSISADGRYIAFQSNSTTLVSSPALSQGGKDIFVRDLATGETELISVGVTGAQARYVGNPTLFAFSTSPGISADGRFVVFASDAKDLVTPDATTSHLYRRDRVNRVTEMVDLKGADGTASASAGSGASLSADGRYVAFRSSASDLVAGASGTHLYRRDMTKTGADATKNALVSIKHDGTIGAPSGGDSGSPSISGDGRYVAFDSTATDGGGTSYVVNGLNLQSQRQVFLRDMNSTTNAATLISVSRTGGIPTLSSSATAASAPKISRDSRYVAFTSDGDDFVAGESDSNSVMDVFQRGPLSGGTPATIRVSKGAQGEEPYVISSTPRLSDDGRYVTFVTVSGNLVPNDANQANDCFVRDTVSGSTDRVSVGTYGVEGLGSQASLNAVISGDGRTIAFESAASNWIPDDTNGQSDIFVRANPF